MKVNSNIRVGIFVLAAILLLISALYFIGSKQNLFGSTFRISARFFNVNGLMQGNNVRFAGIDVGTVESIEIVNDSTVNVMMVIEKKVQPYIRVNAIASVGTDGLMGNKLVNINSGNSAANVIQEGQSIQTLKPVEMDEMLRTLNMTNRNIGAISGNLRNITDKINSENSLWKLLMDTVIAGNVKTSFVNLRLMSQSGAVMAGDLKDLTAKIKRGEGSFGALVNDSSLAIKLNRAADKLQNFGDTAVQLSADLSQILQKVKRGEGTAGILINDTTLAYGLNQSILSINKGAGSFDENMIAVRQSWPFKKYFRKQARNSQTQSKTSQR